MIFVEPDVQRRLVGLLPPAQHLGRLMVLEHLDGRHRLDRHVARGLIITVAQQILALDIKMAYGFALIGDRPIVGHLDAGHFLQHVFEVRIFGAHERAHVVDNGVALEPDGRHLDGHLANLDSLLDQPHAVGRRGRKILGREPLPSVAHPRKDKHIGIGASHVQTSLGVRNAVGAERVLGIVDAAGGREDGLVGARIHHHKRIVGLRRLSLHLGPRQKKQYCPRKAIPLQNISGHDITQVRSDCMVSTSPTPWCSRAARRRRCS